MLCLFNIGPTVVLILLWKLMQLFMLLTRAYSFVTVVIIFQLSRSFNVLYAGFAVHLLLIKLIEQVLQ